MEERYIPEGGKNRQEEQESEYYRPYVTLYFYFI